jgi:hypothetical protein
MRDRWRRACAFAFVCLVLLGGYVLIVGGLVWLSFPHWLR